MFLLVDKNELGGIILKQMIREIAESYLYYIACLVVYFILVHFHVRPYYPQKHFGFWTIMLTIAVTMYGGGFLIKKYERYLLKRDAINILREQGYKKSDIEKIEIFRDGDDEVVEITLKDDQGEKK
jgi:hypothetical protein